MKYLSSLIYIAPLYHKKFSALSRLVLLVTDLMFQSPIRDLWRQTLAFSPGQCSVSASPPTSRPTTGTGWRRSEAIGRTLTSGGRSRALRDSTLGWDSMTSAASATVVGHTTSSSNGNSRLSKYSMKITLGDQDWFTMLGWKSPVHHQVQAGEQHGVGGGVPQIQLLCAAP